MLHEIDFADLYRNQKSVSAFRSKKSDEWDEKATDFNARVHQSAYIHDFIKRMNLEGCESLLDVGCGPGTLTLPLATALDKVHAMDFSAKMLECLRDNAQNCKLSNIQTYHLAWENDWSALPEVDVAIASRSIEVADLKTALEKLSQKARKRAYITYKTGGGFVDERLLEALGRPVATRPDYLYPIAILWQMGYFPKVDYIDIEGGSVRYDDKERFLKTLAWSLGELQPQEIERAEHFYDEVIMRGWRPKPFRWAFIHWETR
ncbi:MAG: class I SAM-dependent methyltransferase [Campylobacterales bacterium]